MRIAIIGAGIVGTCTAAWLQRDGHEVSFIDPLEAGLSVRWQHLPRVAPWLARMMRHSTRGEVARIAGALRNLLEPIFDSYAPLLEHAEAQSLVRRNGCLYVYSSRETAARWQWGMDLRRRLGVRLLDVERDELESLEPDLKGEFRFGLLAPDNGSTVDPSALVKRIHARCLRDGATHERQRAVGMVRRGGTVDAVLLSDDRPAAQGERAVPAPGYHSRHTMDGAPPLHARQPPRDRPRAVGCQRLAGVRPRARRDVRRRDHRQGNREPGRGPCTRGRPRSVLGGALRMTAAMPASMSSGREAPTPDSRHRCSRVGGGEVVAVKWRR